MMIVYEDLVGLGQPDLFTVTMFDEAVAAAKSRLGEPPASLRLERYREGLSVQTMYIGPPSDEGPTIARRCAIPS